MLVERANKFLKTIFSSIKHIEKLVFFLGEYFFGIIGGILVMY